MAQPAAKKAAKQDTSDVFKAFSKAKVQPKREPEPKPKSPPVEDEDGTYANLVLSLLTKNLQSQWAVYLQTRTKTRTWWRRRQTASKQPLLGRSERRARHN